MFAVYLASASSDWLGLALALAVAGSLGFFSSRTRKFVLVLLILGMASTAFAVPFNCPELWRYLGICG